MMMADRRHGHRRSSSSSTTKSCATASSSSSTGSTRRSIPKETNASSPTSSLGKIEHKNVEMDSRSAGGSIRIQHLTGSNNQSLSRFPKLEECAHFHYEQVELGPLQISLYEEEDLKSFSSLESNENSENKWIVVKVVSQGQSWLLRRTYENFRMLDQQLHQCIYDRKFSALPELPPLENLPDKQDPQAYVKKQLMKYCDRFSIIAGNLINCGPILSWLQLDNRGRRILVTDGDNCPINTPAVAAAYAVKKYTAVASDEISFEIGDMISVIDMPPPEDSLWWRGKRGFLVGFFPSHSVAVITDKVPRNVHLNQPTTIVEPTKPVLRKHGKLIAFFRAFILNRPSRRHLKQSGILKERVFGCDLGEHLLNTGRDIPMVLKCCSQFIELHGIVDGIYRLSGVTSNIQKLRTIFDEDRKPALYNDENILQDIHSVASLLKMYFRELPNPLCTYQLYKSFVAAVQHTDEKERINLMRDAVRKLPPPHYRTLEFLMKHLARVAEHGTRTGMTARNIAIVWAPNLLRCKELEVGGVAALQGVGVQAVVTEFLITHIDLVFSPCESQISSQATSRRSRPKSLSIGTPSRLLSLEEAQIKKMTDQSHDSYIEVGGGPACLPEKYHTVIELPVRKRPPLKRSPLGWKSLFTRSTSSANSSIRKSSSNVSSCSNKRKTSVPNDVIYGTVGLSCIDSDIRNKLRTVKSAESLTSNSNGPSIRNSLVYDHVGSPPSPKLTNPGHSRTVSHESYFDNLDENTPVHSSTILNDEEGLSDLQVNFNLDESEMQIFSEEDCTQAFSSGSERLQGSIHGAELASAENTITADPSPKKHKTNDSGSSNSISFSDDVTAVSHKRSRLEDRLSNGNDFAFIDSSLASERITVEADVHDENSAMSQASSPLTGITYTENDSVSTYTLSDAAGIMNGYTPLSEETYSGINSMCNSTTSGFKSSTIFEDNNNKSYDNYCRNRHSYQGDLKFNNNSPRNNNRLSLQGINSGVVMKTNSQHRLNINLNNKPVDYNKSHSEICLTKNSGQQSKNLSSAPSYEYVSTNVAAFSSKNNISSPNLCISNSSNNKNKIYNENKYEYISPSAIGGSNSDMNNLSHSCNFKNNDDNSICPDNNNCFNNNEQNRLNRISIDHDSSEIIRNNIGSSSSSTIESPYELVSVIDNKLTPVTLEEHIGLLKGSKTTDMDSSYEEVSLLQRSLSNAGAPSSSVSSNDEAMIENHLYESLITEDSSPEMSNTNNTTFVTLPGRDAAGRNSFIKSDDSENDGYETLVINNEDYSYDDVMSTSNNNNDDNHPLLGNKNFLKKKETIYSDGDVKILGNAEFTDENNFNIKDHPIEISNKKFDNESFSKRPTTLELTNSNNKSAKSSEPVICYVSNDAQSPMHQALQKLEKHSNVYDNNHFFKNRSENNLVVFDHGYTAADTKCNSNNIQNLMSKFENIAENSISDREGSVPPFTKRSSDSLLAGETINQKLTHTTSSPSLSRVTSSSESLFPKSPEDTDDVVRRERIEKYKEVRRTLLRQKYKTDNIKDCDEQEEEMIRRFKQKIQKHNNISSSNQQQGNQDLVEKFQDQKKLTTSPVSCSNSSADCSPKSPNITTINILYSPTRNSANNNKISENFEYPSVENISNSAVAAQLDDKNASSSFRTTKINTLAKQIPDKKQSFTSSLERRKIRRDKSDSFVAQRVNQLSGMVESSAVEQPFRKTSLMEPKSSSSSLVRQRAHSTSGPTVQYCIRDIAAIFENKDNK